MSTTRTTTTRRTTNRKESTMQTITATETIALAASNLVDEPAKHTMVEPDLYDDGKAIWLLPTAVVAVDVTRVDDLPMTVGTAARYHDVEGGWVRIHPSHYGVEVDSYFDHGNGIEAHSAHEAWRLLDNLV